MSEKRLPSVGRVCPRSPGHFEGSYIGDDRCTVTHVRSQIPCNSWDCPVCNPRKVKKLRRRIFKGPIMQAFEKKDGYGKNPYMVKMFTLTCPGESYRASHDPAAADQEMKKNINRLMTAVRKKYGKNFHYVLFVEPQKKDGFPHYHILMAGPAIVPKSLYWYIRDLWQNHYSMGFIWVTVKPKNPAHAVRYITKYLTKLQRPMRKGGRLYTASKYALEPLPKKHFWIRNSVTLGRLGLPPKKCTTYISPFTVSQAVWEALSPRLQFDTFPELFQLSEFVLYPDAVPF